MATKEDKSLGTLSEKLGRIQVELKAPKNLRNTFGNYNYRNAEGILEALKPLEKSYGVFTTLSDEIVEVGGRIYVKATATISDSVGADSISVTAYAREAESKKGMDDAQITGATSSYARKYALNGLFLLDDTKDSDSDEFQVESKARSKKEERQAVKKEEAKATASFICETCGKPISSIGKFTPSDIAKETLSKFNKQLCYECGKAFKEELERKYKDDKAAESGLPFPIDD